jgi:hypothetical protein
MFERIFLCLFRMRSRQGASALFSFSLLDNRIAPGGKKNLLWSLFVSTVLMHGGALRPV